MHAPDATRLAGAAYNTRLAHGGAMAPDDKTRLTQEGYQSRLVRDAPGGQPDTNEFYKLGDKIGGRYEVSAVHHGELGVVYGCFDHQTKLPRALKTVRARYARDEYARALFEREAAVWISLEKHPYIVRAYLVERIRGLPYVITEYVRGPEGMEGDLRGWLGHPRLTLPAAAAIALQIAQGMQHAVRKVPDLVHRDLKPANILINRNGKAMVTDFGLVHAAQSGAGTPAYLSPEQWRAEALDARSDIYAYGCILFEMLTAHRLFAALTERDWERAHLESVPVYLTRLVPELPVEIDQFVRSCLAKDPAARPRNWDEIVAFFAAWYHQLSGKAVVMDFSSLALDATELGDTGYSLWNLKCYEEAIQAFDRALAIDPSYVFAQFGKGAALEGLERYEEAIQAYEQSLAMDPSDEFAWFGKGNVLGELKRYEEAIYAYDQCLAINQNFVQAWDGKGNVLRDIKRYDEAIQAYDEALRIDSTFRSAREDRAIALRLSTLSEGATVKGIVKAVSEYGAFVDLGGVDGLLHVSDLAWRRLEHPSEVLSVGDEVTTKVLKIDTYKHRVSLGTKQLIEDPLVGIVRDCPPGSRLNGIVTYVGEHGAFVEIVGGLEGLVHKSDMSWAKKDVNPSDVVKVGDNVEVMILGIDEERRRVSLGMKQCMPNP